MDQDYSNGSFQLAGQNLGHVFNFRSGHLHAAKFLLLSIKLPNLQMKTRPKQLLGSLRVVLFPPHLNVRDPLISTTKRCFLPIYIKHIGMYYRYLEPGKAKL